MLDVNLDSLKFRERAKCEKFEIFAKRFSLFAENWNVSVNIHYKIKTHYSHYISANI